MLFLERSLAEQAADRGLKELLFDTGHGRRVALAHQKLVPLVDQLIARAKAGGDLHPDVEGPDMFVLQLMIGADIDFTERGAHDTSRRYLELMLNGLRRRDDQPAALSPPPLEDQTLERAMQAFAPSRGLPVRRDIPHLEPSPE